MIFKYFIQYCLICHPSDSTVSENAWFEPRTVATFTLAVRRYNSAKPNFARSHPDSVRSHPLSARSHLHSATVDLIHTRLDLIHTRQVHCRLVLIQKFKSFFLLPRRSNGQETHRRLLPLEILRNFLFQVRILKQPPPIEWINTPVNDKPHGEGNSSFRS